MRMPALLSAAVFMLLFPGSLTENSEPVPIKVVVKNSLLDTDPLTYSTHVISRGILLGGLKRLMDTNANFKFTYTEDPNFGPYLESVNGLAASDKEHTYWELLVRTPSHKTIRLDVGIGCYIPEANEEIILRFTKSEG